MKKYFTPINTAFILWSILLITIATFFRDNMRLFLYLSITVFIPFVIWDILKQSKKFKTEGTKDIYNSINRMVIIAVVLVIIFAMAEQNYL
ncbi:hypothetical protein [Flavobacterium panacagri]|uniref:hypothetical protein n=1 Tax=Flavobacterium panacagri TaxID=3034146 RepID=UPI0025A607E1|nr:hypothetical protein [Flavobacterium panacagri]